MLTSDADTVFDDDHDDDDDDDNDDNDDDHDDDHDDDSVRYPFIRVRARSRLLAFYW